MDSILDEMLADLPPEKPLGTSNQNKNDSDISEALLILFDFFGHGVKLRSMKQTLCDAIHNYLYTCGRSEKRNLQTELIGCICEKAIELLPDGKTDSFFSPVISNSRSKKVEKPLYLFEPRWLTNVPLLLPEDGKMGKAVIQCLPYVLICYAGNAPKQKIDTFNSDNKSGAWDDIFDPSKNVAVGDGNRSRTIKAMCKYFTELPDSLTWKGLLESGEEFLYDHTVPIGNVEQEEDSSFCPGSLPLKSKSPQWKNARKQSWSYAKCWELYRQFAAFCEACEDVKEVNLTLSMALFANGLKMGPKPESVVRYSWKSIDNDFLRGEILAIMRRCDENGFIQGVHQRAQIARFHYLNICKER